jgi:hypothetical protein
LNNIISVPTRLATLTLAKAIESQRTTLAVVKLNKTRVSMNFQKPATVGTRPTSPYTIPPNIIGGTRRRGRISNKICERAQSLVQKFWR